VFLLIVFIAAAASYAASVALGVLVGTGRVDSRPFHWLHHALYASTFVLAAATVAVALFARSIVAAFLGPPLVAFAAIPFLGTRRVRHPVVGLLPAPFYIAAAVALGVS
jgi:hypothetical protein